MFPDAKKFKDEFESIQKKLEDEDSADAESEKLAKELQGLEVKEGGEERKESDTDKNAETEKNKDIEVSKQDQMPDSDDKKSDDVPDK